MYLALKLGDEITNFSHSPYLAISDRGATVSPVVQTWKEGQENSYPSSGKNGAHERSAQTIGAIGSKVEISRRGLPMTW